MTRAPCGQAWRLVASTDPGGSANLVDTCDSLNCWANGTDAFRATGSMQSAKPRTWSDDTASGFFRLTTRITQDSPSG